MGHRFRVRVGHRFKVRVGHGLKDALNNAPELAEGLLSHVRAAEACECFLRTKHYDQAATYIDNKHVDAFCGGLHISIKIIDEEYRS